MKTRERNFCCTTYTTNKKQRVFIALTGIGEKYTTYTVSIPLKPLAEKSRISGIGGIAGTAAIPVPTPAESRAVRGLRLGGVGGTAKIDFFSFFYFRRIFEEKYADYVNRFHVGGESLNKLAVPGLRSRRPTVTGHLSNLFRNLKMTTTINPLAELRRQGLEADIFKARLRVYPRRRMNKAICQYVTEHLAAIVDALIAEQKAKSGDNELLWDLPIKVGVENFGFEVDMREVIPNHLNGQFFAETVKAAI